MCDKNKWKPLKVQLETDFSSSQVFLNRGSNKSQLGKGRHFRKQARSSCTVIGAKNKPQPLPHPN